MTDEVQETPDLVGTDVPEQGLTEEEMREAEALARKIKTFVVLGPPACSSSLISNALEKQGVSMICSCDQFGENERYDEGPHEDALLFGINEAIVKQARLVPGDPENERRLDTIGAYFRPMMRSIVEDRNKVDMWGWKEPRTAITIRAWAPLLSDPHYVAIFRTPIKIAESLRRERGWPLERGMTVARTYYKRIIAFLQEFVDGDHAYGSDIGLPVLSTDGAEGDMELLATEKPPGENEALLGIQRRVLQERKAKLEGREMPG